MPDAGGESVPPVSDDENLYRSIWLKPQCFSLDENGALRVSPEAFADKSKRPSLFRHDLCDAPPHSNPPRLGPDQAVASLLAGNIREKAGPIVHQAEKREPVTYLIDIAPDLSDGQHRSHAIVFATPAFETRRAFEKLKLRLALLVEALVIPPPAEFVNELRGTPQ
jgi:hypothetical protein